MSDAAASRPLTTLARLHLTVRDRLARGHTVADLSPEQISGLQALEPRLTAPRRTLARLHRLRPQPLSVKDFRLDGSEIRCWWPAPHQAAQQPSGPRPAVVLVHGGGFVFGSPARNDWMARQLAARTGAVVASPSYRLAPTHPHPAAVDDVWAATLALSTRVDPGRMVLAGESAGGFLAALAALRWRDAVRRGRLDWDLRGLLLVYPATDLNLDRDPVSGPRLQARDLATFARLYLGQANHVVSPMAQQDLTGLPPTLVQTADHDPLERDGLAFVRRLRSAAVPVTHTRYLGAAHGFLSTPRLAPQARPAISEQAAFISRLMAPD